MNVPSEKAKVSSVVMYEACEFSVRCQLASPQDALGLITLNVVQCPNKQPFEARPCSNALVLLA